MAVVLSGRVGPLATTKGELMVEPTTEKLAKALEEVNAPSEMIYKARAGYYDDFKSPLAMPEMQLLADARMYNLESIAQGVMEGKWDSTKEESDEWAKSPEGQEVFDQLVRPNRQQRRHPKGGK
jgi:hypothetical protein